MKTFLKVYLGLHAALASILISAWVGATVEAHLGKGCGWDVVAFFSTLFFFVAVGVAVVGGRK